MGLLGIFKKKKRTNSVGEDLDRLTPEGALPFGWMAYNKEIIEQMDAEERMFRNAINDAVDPITKYAAMKSYLMFLEDGKKHYTNINVCAGKYFEEYIYDSPGSDLIKEKYIKLVKELKKKEVSKND